MKNKQKIKILEVELQQAKDTIKKLSHSMTWYKENLDSQVNASHKLESALESAESALNYKEIRENDIAEFMAKVLKNYG